MDALAAVNAVDYDNVEEAELQSVQVYPNPTTGSFTVSCEGMSQIDIYAIDGRLVRSIRADRDSYQIDGLESGIYMLQVTNGSSSFAQKIIIY